MSSAWSWATLIAAVGCGLVAGPAADDRAPRGAWTAWNHVRGALSAAAAALLTIALASE
jgi:uncharacterized membrane protein